MKCPHCKKETSSSIVKFKTLKIEVDFEQKFNGKKFKDVKIPKGWRLLRIEELGEVMNYIQENSLDIWSFFEQPIKNFKNKKVARFVAYSGYCDLGCVRGSGYSYSDLGVIFCRDLKK